MSGWRDLLPPLAVALLTGGVVLATIVGLHGGPGQHRVAPATPVAPTPLATLVLPDGGVIEGYGVGADACYVARVNSDGHQRQPLNCTPAQP